MDRRKSTHARGAFLMAEVLVALGLVTALLVAVSGMLADTTRVTSDSQRRLPFEVRARRHLAELSTTTYETLISTAGSDYPVRLSDPGDPDFAALKEGLSEVTRVEEVKPGLARATTHIVWHDPATRSQRKQLVAERLLVRATLSLVSNEPFQGGTP